ncbi:MAG TPA: phage holin family protein [Fimbriimonadaceae bacterium]|nr:phage holin family protein [Fimbriimonadaceae bacterium]
MTKLLLRWILLAFSVVAASYVSQALGLGFEVDVHDASGFLKLLIGVAILSLLNATVGKLIKFLTLPLSCITLGLFSLVINAVVLMAAASFRLGFHITGSGFNAFIAAFVASLMIAFINGVLGMFLPDDKDE